MRRFLTLSLLAAALLVAIASVPAAAVELNLEAEIAKGAKQPVKQPVEWTVTKMFSDKKPGEVVANAREVAPKFALEPGIYLVTAKLGLAKAEQTVELTKVAVLLRLNLNAGIVRLSMIPHAGAPVIKDVVHWELFPYRKGGGLPARVAEANAPATEFILPAGGWVARATYDGTMSELVIPLEAGQTYNYTLNLYAGKAKLTAANQGGGTFKDPVVWEVVRANDRNDLVASTTSPAPQVTLREGSYIVLARQGTFAGEAPLEVKAGKTATAKVSMATVTPEQVAVLEAAARKRVELAQAALAPKPAAATQVAAAAGTTTTRSLADTLKSADAKGQAGSGAAAAALVPVAAAAAAPQPALAALPPAPAAAATALAEGAGKVSAVGPKGGTFKDPVIYEVVRADDQNKLIAGATAPTHQFALPEGRYVVLARQGSYAGAAALAITAGGTASAAVPMAKVNAEQVAALEQASKKRAEMAALAAQAAAAPATELAAAPAATAPQATDAAPVGAAEALAAADAAAQPAPAALEASPTRTLAETLRAAEALQKAAKAQESGEPRVEAAAAAEAAPETAAETVAAATDAAAAPAPAAPVPDATAAAAAGPEAAVAALPATTAAPAADQPDGSVNVTAWSQNVDKFRDAVEWEIRRVQPSGAVLPDLVASHKGAAHEFSLPPGSYVIWGRQGTLIGKQKFDVEPDGTVAIRVYMQTPKVSDTPAAAASAETEETPSASSGG